MSPGPPDQAPEQIRLSTFDHPMTGTAHGAAFAQVEPDFDGKPYLAIQPARGGAAFRWLLKEARQVFADHPQLAEYLDRYDAEGQPKASASAAEPAAEPGSPAPGQPASGPGPTPAPAPPRQGA